MKVFSIPLTLASLSILLVLGCNSTLSSPGEANTIEENEMISIVDATGKKWDVTHARDVYGMDPLKFQFGLGPFAIRPILNPKMLSPGEAGYPQESESFLVLGATLNGNTRAYPISRLTMVEIADEKFGDSHVAVAY